MAFSTVKGTVSRVFFNGCGAEVTESFTKRDGSEGTSRWAAFFDKPHGLSEGDVVEVSGQHSDKIDEWEKDGQTRRTVKRTLNRARIKPGNGSSSPVDAFSPVGGTTTPVGDSNVSGGGFGYNDETPF